MTVLGYLCQKLANENKLLFKFEGETLLGAMFGFLGKLVLHIKDCVQYKTMERS